MSDRLIRSLRLDDFVVDTKQQKWGGPLANKWGSVFVARQLECQ